MYSVVLMAALTTAPEMPNWGMKCGCCGYSSACHGCYGGCYGCYGGCYGCYGGWNSCSGCWGSCSGCYGCYGFYGGCAGSYYSPYGPMYMIQPMAPVKEAGKGEAVPAPKKDDKPAPMGAAGNSAKLIVELPEGAKFFVDNQPVAATGVKTFNTPALEKGQAYYYTVRAELVRGGKPVSETHTVIVRAGETSRVAFPELAGGPAEKPVATVSK